MVRSHRCSAEESTSAPLLPEKAEEVWNAPQHPQIFLHLQSKNANCYARFAIAFSLSQLMHPHMEMQLKIQFAISFEKIIFLRIITIIVIYLS